MTSINHLARYQVKKLTPYLSARRIGGEGDLWLNANESPFCHDYRIDTSQLNRYNECQPKALIEAYAHYAKVDAQQVLACRGADEGIDLLIRAFCEPNQDSILYCPPTYGMYAANAEMMGVERKKVPLTSNWQLDLSTIKSHLKTVKLLFLCSPNNPTGNLIKKEDIITLLNMTKGQAIIVIDEAYIDFYMEQSVKELLQRYTNLVILRTLSKAFSLAGLRCGFVLANDEVIQVLLKVIAPYPLPTPVIDIAIKSLLNNNLCNLFKVIDQLNENREYLYQQLIKIPHITVYPSWGNYLLVHFYNGDFLFQSAWDNGIILRKTTIKNCVRISVGNLNDCKKVEAFIQSFYVKNPVLSN